MLSLGSSKPWPEALEIVTGQRKMTADALLEYFKPLHTWLEKKNQETGAHIGWESEYRKMIEICNDFDELFPLIMCFYLSSQ